MKRSRRGLTSPRYLGAIGLRASRAEAKVAELVDVIEERGAGADWPVGTLDSVRRFLQSIRDYASEGAELMVEGDYQELGAWTRNGPRLRHGDTVLHESSPCQDGPGDGAPGG